MIKVTQNINLLVECQRRFEKKPWYNAKRINALLGRLAFLNDDEIDLVLDLTDRFQFLKITELNSKLINAYRKIPATLLQDTPRILFAPLKSPYSKAEKRTLQRRKRERIRPLEPLLTDPGKSCDVIFRIMLIDYPAEYAPYDQKTYICNEPIDIVDNYVNNGLIVLWDDFVGSGESAFNAIADIQKFLVDHGKITQENNYVVVCMCAMQDGLWNLDYCSLKCYASDVYIKAITDDKRFDLQQRQQRIGFMKSAEEKVVKRALKKYSLGYSQSEALLSIMDKCPNNTLPFYWFASQHNISPVFYRFK